MVVVAIVGVLSTIALPNYQLMAARARQVEAKNALSAMYVVEKTYYAEATSYTLCLYQGGYIPEGARRFYTTGFQGSVSACRSCILMIDSRRTCSFSPQPWALGSRNDATFLENAFANPALASAGTNVIFDAYSNNFNVGASGSISSLAIFDLWQIDENRVVTNVQPGI